jgi:putative PIN family toxin of toxin-antitoxin system
MLAKLTSKNQLTLPKSITRAIGASEYFDVKVEDGQIILTPVKIQRADAVRSKLAELELSEQDITDAVAWARKGLSHRLRVVIDTNLVLSALVFGGSTARLRLAWQRDRFIPLVSKATITELIMVLAYPKFKLTKAEQEDLLADYLLFCEMVLMPGKLPTIPECCDPFDDPFLVLALVGNADYLVTGDRDLLCLVDSFAYPIVTVEQFFAVF